LSREITEFTKNTKATKENKRIIDFLGDLRWLRGLRDFFASPTMFNRGNP